MAFSASASRSSSGAHTFARTIRRWFPRPAAVLPDGAGIDISDSSIKWLTLEGAQGSGRVRTYGQEPLEDGIVVNGVLRDVDRLGKSLAHLRPKLGAECAHVALPEEAAYVFNMHVPKESSREQILSMVEFELEGRVPIAPSAAVYDFEVIAEYGEGLGTEIGVSVFSQELAKNYTEAFARAGITLLSLEVEAASIARAISGASEQEPVSMVVDLGRDRIGVAVLKHSVPIFTSTLVAGDETIDRMLAEEIAHHFRYWDTRRNEQGDRAAPIERVFLVGGGVDRDGLEDHIASRVQVPCERPDVWRNVSSFEEYVPPVERGASLRYATAIGLALRSF